MIVAQQDISEELDLIRLAQVGDSDAIGALYELYCDRVYAYAYAKLGNHAAAEDVTSQVFLKMVEKIAGFNQQGAGFAAWLFRIAHNQLIDGIRWRARRPVVPLDLAYTVVVADGNDPPQQAEKREFMDKLKIAIGELSELQAQVIILKYASELSNPEIAEVTGRSTNAVNSLHYEGLKKLRKVLEKKGYTF